MEEKSRFYVEFAGLNSTMFETKVENVTVMQLAALVMYLDNKVRFMMTQQEIMQAQQAEMNRITVPKPNIEVGRK